MGWGAVVSVINDWLGELVIYYPRVGWLQYGENTKLVMRIGKYAIIIRPT